MQRAAPITFIALLLASITYVLAHAARQEGHAARPIATTAATPTAAPSSTASAPPKEADAGVTPPPVGDLETVLRGGAVPPLPNGAPTTVGLAIILFTHEQAQFAGKQARPKREAFRLAKELLPEAVENFAEAVKKGDPGSTTDAGKVPRGVLEPALQYVVYTLEKGQVFPEPLDTPRGFWIVKRTR